MSAIYKHFHIALEVCRKRFKLLFSGVNCHIIDDDTTNYCKPPTHETISRVLLEYTQIETVHGG